MSAQVYSVPGQTEGKRKFFGMEKYKLILWTISYMWG